MRDKTWEEETLDLIKGAETQKKRSEEKVQAAKEALAKADLWLSAHLLTLEAYQIKHGLETAIAGVDDVLARYRGLTAKQMLQYWQEAHGGRIVMKEACKLLTAAGLFTDKAQAAGTLYSALKRMKGFKKELPGVYVWKGTGVDWGAKSFGNGQGPELDEELSSTLGLTPQSVQLPSIKSRFGS